MPEPPCEDGRRMLKRYRDVIAGLAIVLLTLGLANIAFFSVGYAYSNVSAHCSLYYTGDGWWCSTFFLLGGSFALVHALVRGSTWAVVSLSFTALSAIFSLIELVMSADALACDYAIKNTSYTMRWLMVVVEAFLLVFSLALVDLQVFYGRIDWKALIPANKGQVESTNGTASGGTVAPGGTASGGTAPGGTTDQTKTEPPTETT